MKTHEIILLEMGAGRIRCFNGHIESFKRFEKCCEKFLKSEWGMARCLIRTIENRVLPEVLTGIKAAMEIAPSRISPILLDSAFRFRNSIHRKLENFCNPRSMVRYENMDEIREGLDQIGISEPEVSEETLAEIDNLYEKFCLMPMRLEHKKGKLTAVVGSEESDLDWQCYKVTIPSLERFLRILTGVPDLRIREIFGPRKVKVLARGKKTVVNLGTLVSCGIVMGA